MRIPFDKIIEVSLALAGKNPNPRYKHFSFIVDRSRIVSVGLNNQSKTHPLTRKYNYWCENLHSELSAVIKLGEEDCSDLVIVNTRLNRNNIFRNSRFCKGCSDMCRKLNFSEMWFTNEQGEFEKYS